MLNLTTWEKLRLLHTKNLRKIGRILQLKSLTLSFPVYTKGWKQQWENRSRRKQDNRFLDEIDFLNVKKIFLSLSEKKMQIKSAQRHHFVVGLQIRHASECILWACWLGYKIGCLRNLGDRPSA